jgi:hypothetical protein
VCALGDVKLDDRLKVAVFTLVAVFLVALL